MFCIFSFSYLACNQMWLNLPMDDPHFWLHHKIDNKKHWEGRTDGRTDRGSERKRVLLKCNGVLQQQLVFCGVVFFLLGVLLK
jgi:hypothetical protein